MSGEVESTEICDCLNVGVLKGGEGKTAAQILTWTIVWTIMSFTKTAKIQIQNKGVMGEKGKSSALAMFGL